MIYIHKIIYNLKILTLTVAQHMKKNWKRLMVFMLLIGFWIGFDQAAKVVAKDYLALSRPVAYLNDMKD